MTIFVTILFVISCLILIASILMHSGRSAGLSGSIGGGAEQLFGKQKGKEYDEIFDKITKIAAVAFIIASLALVALQ
jgi:preprotein translocase subunit SecG